MIETIKDIDTINFLCDYSAYELYKEGFLVNKKENIDCMFAGLQHKIVFDQKTFSIFIGVFDSPCNNDVVVE